MKTIELGCRYDLDLVYVFTLNSVIGHAAQWAVRQSPYPAPNNLELVLTELRTRLTPVFNHGISDFPVLKANGKRLTDILNEQLLNIEAVQEWNERKNGRPGHGFTDLFTIIPPDDDFIDLGALVANIVRSVVQEAECDRQSDMRISATCE